MTYEQATHFAQTWGLVFATLLFAVAALYALWPANRKTFDEAAHTPLAKDDDDVRAR